MELRWWTCEITERALTNGSLFLFCVRCRDDVNAKNSDGAASDFRAWAGALAGAGLSASFRHCSGTSWREVAGTLQREAGAGIWCCRRCSRYDRSDKHRCTSYDALISPADAKEDVGCGLLIDRIIVFSKTICAEGGGMRDIVV